MLTRLLKSTPVFIFICLLTATVAQTARADLANPGFEAAGGGMDGWVTFNNEISNIAIDSGTALEGSNAVKMFGGFNGPSNVTALYQGVDTAGGNVWRAACYVRHNSGDSLAGTGNQLVMKIEFYSAFGGAYGSADFIEEHQIPVLNAAAPEDRWLYRTFQATAPPNAVEARVSLVFIQPNNEGGAAYIDAVTLENLTTDAPPAWDVIWNDEFNGSAVNTDRWNVADIHYNKNNELQYYAPDDVYIQNGNLVLRSQQRPYWGFDDRGDWRYFDYTSGLVDTRGKFPFVYGRVDIRAKLPGTRGLWPAHWMLSQTGAWPPEIDITEMTGDLPNRIVTSLHWGPLPPGTYPWDIGQTASSVHWGPDYTQGFHNYSMEWLPGLLNFYIDDTVRFSVSRDEIPDETMYLILNTAVGGDWPGSPDGSTILPQFHEIDYVRVSVPADPGYGVASFVDQASAGATADSTIEADEYSTSIAGLNDGFGDVLGENSELKIESSADGDLFFALQSETLLSPAGTGGVVIYIDSVSGGAVSTAGMNASADLQQRLASGTGVAGERAKLFFSPGFRADYAVVMGPARAMVYLIFNLQLVPLGGAQVNAELDIDGGTDFSYRLGGGSDGIRQRELRLPLNRVGMQPGDECHLMATLLDGSNAFRSNEFVGIHSGNWWDGQNPGQADVVLKQGDFITFTTAILRGDVNTDGAVNGSDVQGFVSGLLEAAPSCDAPCYSDMNGDELTNLADVPLFVEAMIGE